MSKKEQIQMCLNCPKVDCDNCLDTILKETSGNKESKRKKINLYHIDDEFYTLKEWSKILNIKYTTLTARIRRGVEFGNMKEAKLYRDTKVTKHRNNIDFIKTA